MEKFSFNNKTIIFLIKVAALGGAERQALGLAGYLIKEYNCKVHLIATHSNEMTDEFRQFASECGIVNIEYFGTPSLTINKEFSIQNLKKTVRALKYIYKIKNEISKYKPDIIIPFLNTPSKLSALICKATGAKITFWHQLGLDTYSYDIIEKLAVKRTKYFIANAVNGLAVFREKYKVPEHKLFLLPQYVSIQKIDYDQISLRKEFSINDDAIVIGMIAHYREEKHHELLLEAFHEICHYANIHLVLLGNKDNDADTLSKYNKLKSKMHSLGIEKKVSLLSQVSVEKILNLIDIGVLVSEYEGVPTVIMEA